MKNDNTIIYLLGRDDWQKDDFLNNILVEFLRNTECKIVWEDPAGTILYKLRNFEKKFTWLPAQLKKFNLRSIQVIYAFFHWNYFNYLWKQRNRTVALRTSLLRKRLQKIDSSKTVIIISRSSGGRVASLVADEFQIKHIVCLGYPFKHPRQEVDPTRYLHLESLNTSMTIFQGKGDEYGGIDVQNKYSLSSSIELIFVDGNHNFKISESEWKRVLYKIRSVIYD